MNPHDRSPAVCLCLETRSVVILATVQIASSLLLMTIVLGFGHGQRPMPAFQASTRILTRPWMRSGVGGGGSEGEGVEMIVRGTGFLTDTIFRPFKVSRVWNSGLDLRPPKSDFDHPRHRQHCEGLPERSPFGASDIVRPWMSAGERPCVENFCSGLPDGVA
jgi:hypothetical protein